ncbi:MAG: UvrD-helicase domain-containing protein [Candidatus Symbiothrix sp.]|jgi:DNA helicase-2/ATP-dependent DNA helicase PcrA|nr:UvrD-helicase domain-containing protein [Candidatus Symbiothrix sp.]
MVEFLQQLNENQRDAVLYNEGPSLVIAGAGSGKTRVLTYKIAYLLKNGVSPYTILALTFTNKAAREMKSRIAQIVGEETARRLWMGTFHSVFSRILRREADKMGFRSDFTIYDAQDSKNLLKAIIKEKSLDDKVYKPATVQARISKVKNALITPALYEKDTELLNTDNQTGKAQMSEIYTTYWNRCRTAEVMDFDDLLLYTYLLFRDHPEVIEHYRNQFRYILVDEYQDTNSAQHEIIRQLAGNHHRVCVVGDDAQSIYSFRGANIGNILNFQNMYPESKLFKLEQNYRSTQTIVNAANSLIEKNREQIPKRVYSENTVGEKLQVLSAYSDYEEGYQVAMQIAQIRMLHKYEYKDFAILYRTNAQSRVFEEALRKINIPYQIYGGLSFYQRKEIKDIIAYMRLIANPNDEEAFKRILNYPARGIGATTLDKIVKAANLYGVSLWEVLSNPIDYNLGVNSGTATKLAGFHRLISGFIEDNLTQNAYETGHAIVQRVGLLNELYENKTPEELSRVQNVNELINSLYGFVSTRMEEGNPDIKIRDFLAEISLLTDQDVGKDENADRVSMMTVHSAKGLEFKNVFVVGLEEDLFPSERSRGNYKELEEERRLFYVAITRARENAFLTYSKSRFHNGQFRQSAPSRFLKDIDRQYLKFSEEMNVSAVERMQAPARNPAYTEPSNLSRIKSDESNLVTYQSIGDLSVGNTIRHERFGLGKVIELTGEKDNAKAKVEFESFGSKQLLLKFAKFEIID